MPEHAQRRRRLIGDVALIIRIVVDLPAPFGPRKPNDSPRLQLEVDPVDGAELRGPAARWIDLGEAAGLDHGTFRHGTAYGKRLHLATN